MGSWIPVITVLIVSLGCRGDNKVKELPPGTVQSATVVQNLGVLGDFSSLPDGAAECAPPSPISNYEIKATSSSSETAFGLIMARR